MKTNTWMRAILLLLLFGALAVQLSSAAPPLDGSAPTSAVNKIQKFVKDIFSVTPQALADPQKNLPYVRFMLTVLLFLILYGISDIAPHISEMKRSARMGIAGSISLMSTLLIPGDLIVAIIGTWAAVFLLLLLAIPVSAVIIAMTKLSGDTRGEIAGRGVISIAVAVLLDKASNVFLTYKSPTLYEFFVTVVVVEQWIAIGFYAYTIICLFKLVFHTEHAKAYPARKFFGWRGKVAFDPSAMKDTLNRISLDVDDMLAKNTFDDIIPAARTLERSVLEARRTVETRLSQQLTDFDRKIIKADPKNQSNLQRIRSQLTAIQKNIENEFDNTTTVKAEAIVSEVEKISSGAINKSVAPYTEAEKGATALKKSLIALQRHLDNVQGKTDEFNVALTI